MATPVEDKFVASPEYIHEVPMQASRIQYVNKPAYNLVDFINDNIGIMTVLCFFYSGNDNCLVLFSEK